jgi:hypothetical protein
VGITIEAVGTETIFAGRGRRSGGGYRDWRRR